VTKHAVVALSENTYYALKLRNAKVGVSVLCPGWVRTRIMDSERNRPADLQNPPELQQLTPEMTAVLQYYRAQCEAGLDPAVVAQMVFDGIRAERFYIVTTTDLDPVIQKRMESILQRLDPPQMPL
jgi:short-subunit dehydrogenase